MNTRLITSYEIAEKQQSIISDYQSSQSRISLAGIRQLAGSTFIAMGQRLYGRMEAKCAQAARPSTIAPARGI